MNAGSGQEDVGRRARSGYRIDVDRYLDPRKAFQLPDGRDMQGELSFQRGGAGVALEPQPEAAKMTPLHVGRRRQEGAGQAHAHFRKETFLKLPRSLLHYVDRRMLQRHADKARGWK